MNLSARPSGDFPTAMPSGSGPFGASATGMPAWYSKPVSSVAV